MEPPYRGPGGYGSEEQEFPPFHHRPPPPPPRPEDEGGRFGGGGYEEGGYPRGRRAYEEEERFGRGDDEEGFDRWRGEDERFGRGDDAEGYPPKPPPRFPHLGFQGHPEHHHEGRAHDAYRPSDDAYPEHDGPPPSFTDSDSHYSQKPSSYPQHDTPPPSFTDSDSHYSQKPSTGYTNAEEPVADASLTSQMDSLSLDLPQGRLVRIFCKENPAFSLAVVHSNLQMQDSNAEDESQQWIKDVSHGMRIKDSYGYPAFSLVNKKTKKLLKHANEKGLQVLLVDYQAGLKDDNILWTESQDFGGGFKTVRSAVDTLLNLTVFEGNKRIRNGSALVLDSWHKGDHQVWSLFPL